MNKEIWKNIIGYEGYQISNLGNVRSLDRYVFHNGNKLFCKGKILKPYTNKSNGYKYIGVSLNGKIYNLRLHKLVALAFIPNPNNYTDINHIDGNKQNNIVENLEWCTRSYNLKHARRLGLNKGYKGMTYKKRCQLAIEYIEYALYEEKETPSKYNDWRLDLLEILKESDKE